MEIYQALREFCDIPKGEVFISPEEAEGIRVALIYPFYLEPASLHQSGKESHRDPRHRQHPSANALGAGDDPESLEERRLG